MVISLQQLGSQRLFLGDEKSKQAGQLLLIASQVIEFATKLVRLEDYKAASEPVEEFSFVDGMFFA